MEFQPTFGSILFWHNFYILLHSNDEPVGQASFLCFPSGSSEIIEIIEALTLLL